MSRFSSLRLLLLGLHPINDFGNCSATRPHLFQVGSKGINMGIFFQVVFALKPLLTPEIGNPTFHRDPSPGKDNGLFCHEEVLSRHVDPPLHGSSLHYFEISIKAGMASRPSALCTDCITAWIRATSARMPTVFTSASFFPRDRAKMISPSKVV